VFFLLTSIQLCQRNHMSAILRQWLKGFWRGSKSKKLRPLGKVHSIFEQLEPSPILSGSNAIDRLNFGNPASEASHNLELGSSISRIPLLGAGTDGAAEGQTYPEPIVAQELVFTTAEDSNRQSNLTVRQCCRIKAFRTWLRCSDRLCICVALAAKKD